MANHERRFRLDDARVLTARPLLLSGSRCGLAYVSEERAVELDDDRRVKRTELWRHIVAL